MYVTVLVILFIYIMSVFMTICIYHDVSRLEV